MMFEYSPSNFGEKFLHAIDVARQTKPEGGVCGFELEWNLLNSNLLPLNRIKVGDKKSSFIDQFTKKYIPKFALDRCQTEVFHWMIEWATRPYYNLIGAIFESRLSEAIILNSLDLAGQSLGQSLYIWHGNLFTETQIGHDSIPDSWHIAKRRYLERCVDLFGKSLATAGIHTNLSLPEPLLAWDFVHLSASGYVAVNNTPQHLDDFKNTFYIKATRFFRAFTALFIASSASTPIKSCWIDGKHKIMLSEHDSERNLTFPNPSKLDVPYLYRSYDDYLSISYDLVQRGVRFGNNNWTPVRARSFSEPVERLIMITSDQLQDLYSKGLYGDHDSNDLEALAKKIEVQNLLARINLPMARVEIRTDEGGHPLELDVANLTLKYLLLLLMYANDEFALSFRYDEEDITRARANEFAAAKNGLRADIQNPFTGKPIAMREFLAWTLQLVKPLAEVLGLWENLEPLIAMAKGSRNTAEKIRDNMRSKIGDSDEVPVEVLIELAEERKRDVSRDIDQLLNNIDIISDEKDKFEKFLLSATEAYSEHTDLPIQFHTYSKNKIGVGFRDKTSEIVSLAEELIQIPSVTACPNERIDEVKRAARIIFNYLSNAGLKVKYFNNDKYPAILASLPGVEQAPVMLSGHFDVVEPNPDDSQFNVKIDGDYLVGRGAADMKTVVATYMVWIKDIRHRGDNYPGVNLLLVGNEENGEVEPMGTPHVLNMLKAESSYEPSLLIAGERTGEKGDEKFGEICTKNRGIYRFSVDLISEKKHSGVKDSGDQKVDQMMNVLLDTKAFINKIAESALTASNENGWNSKIMFPFFQVGENGIYNITPGSCSLGVEIRVIPEDDISAILNVIDEYCNTRDLHINMLLGDAGVSCDPANGYLKKLVEAYEEVSLTKPILGKKLAGTSARFAPGGQGVVWGQSGLGPHTRNERHYIPSIYPYYEVLDRYANLL